MGVIYFFITLICARSASLCAECENGGEVLGVIAKYYFHSVGAYLTAAIVTFACLKTAIGLVTSCSEAFVQMFPKGPKYSVWAIIFCLVSFGIANFGLSTIVAWCVPVLMFIYPLAITLILLALTEKWFGGSKTVYVVTTAFTLGGSDPGLPGHAGRDGPPERRAGGGEGFLHRLRSPVQPGHGLDHSRLCWLRGRTRHLPHAERARCKDCRIKNRACCIKSPDPG